MSLLLWRRLASALRAQGSLKAAQVSARSAGQHAGCPADRTAAAQLEAAISQQVAEREAKHQLAQQVEQAKVAASSSSKCTVADSKQQIQPQQHALPGGPAGHQAKAGAVDQLLQQFAAAIKQQARSGAAGPQAADQAAGAAGSTPADVLLPSAARQQELDQQRLSDQIVMPGSSNSSSACRDKQAQACKPLIQEVSGSTQVTEHPARCADSSSAMSKQQQEGCLEQLLDVLD